MCSKGFDWEWAHHACAWSKNGRDYSVKELVDWLYKIIHKQSKLKFTAPTEPEAHVPQRMSLPVLGTQTCDVDELDAKYMGEIDKFQQGAAKLAKEREHVGETSIFSRMQPFYRPNLVDLMNRRS